MGLCISRGVSVAKVEQRDDGTTVPKLENRRRSSYAVVKQEQENGQCIVEYASSVFSMDERKMGRGKIYIRIGLAASSSSLASAPSPG